MSNQAEQNFENHIRHDKMLYVYLVMLLASLVCAVVGVFTSSGWLAAAVMINTVATVLLAANARGYGTKVQDRIVRLEMRLRLAKVLSGELAERVEEFTIPQLVGMRFESDANLLELARKVIDEDLRKSTEIKRLVKDWQADFQRV